jgi:L-amino acid N-acyltransferase YncA
MRGTSLLLRSATPTDAVACAEIYAPYVTDSNISFELQPPTSEQFEHRIAQAQSLHEWIVAERNETVVGYAYAHPFNQRAAYDWSCESSIYVAGTAHREGIGQHLYEELLRRLTARGYRRAFAGIALPNEASVGLHVDLGFEEAGRYRRVGWKNGTWHDVAWMQRDLQHDESDPPTPIQTAS